MVLLKNISVEIIEAMNEIVCFYASKKVFRAWASVRYVSPL